MKFGWPEPPRPKKWWTFIIFHWLERPPTQFIRNPLWNSGISDKLNFSKLVIGKSFSTRLYGYLHRYTQMRGRHICPSPTWDLNMHQEKNLPMVIFLIFVQKNVYRIRFQKIKIGPLKGFEKKGIFLTSTNEKTTFRWSKVVSEAIFPNN